MYCVLFANDIVLVDETKGRVNAKLDSRFSNYVSTSKKEVKIQNREIPKSEVFGNSLFTMMARLGMIFAVSLLGRKPHLECPKD